MKLFSQQLMSEVDIHLQNIHSQTENPLKHAEQAITTLVPIFEKFKTQVVNHTFPNKSEEINFFREIKPQFTAKLIYYNELYNIEVNKPFGSKKTVIEYFNLELQKLQAFYEQNREFYKYYKSASNRLDKIYFLRREYDVSNTIDSNCFQTDARFSTTHDYKVAKIIANDNLKRYIDNEIAILKQKEKLDQNSINAKTQKWTGSKVGLIELLYALHAEGVFNNGTSELKEVATFFETIFDIDLGQFNRVFLEIRGRKSERTKFLSTLKEKLIIRMDNADEN